MKDWICRRCGQEVVADEKPQPIKWSDGHVCYFSEVNGEPPKVEEGKNDR